MAREHIKASKRFKVLNRDNFTCQYCGKKPPQVKLEIDHIKPVSKGGDNSLENLITSCFNCNRGKSSSAIKDGTKVCLKERHAFFHMRKDLEQVFAAICFAGGYTFEQELVWLLRRYFDDPRVARQYGDAINLRVSDLYEEISKDFLEW